MKELNNADMSQFTSFRAGGKVRRFVVVDTIEELKEAVAESLEEAKNVDESEAEASGILLLGNGSNTLFASDYYDGTVIKLGEGFDYIEINEMTKVRVGAATLLSRLAKKVGAEGLTGLEFAGGIPGSVGGAVFMNAGAYDGEIKDTLVGVKVFSPGLLAQADECGDVGTFTRYIPAEELDLSYRHSALMESGDIVLEAEFVLSQGDKDEINALMKDFAERRSSKQPLEYPSAGSFFKRPPETPSGKLFAGKLIEDAGLKGFSVGGAEVSEKHAGFIINKGDATKDDIIKLMEEVQKKVKEDSGIDLEPEVRIIK